jgi:hypothetical protein
MPLSMHDRIPEYFKLYWYHNNIDEFHKICEDSIALVSLLKFLLYNFTFLMFQELLLQDIDCTFLTNESKSTMDISANEKRNEMYQAA